MLVLSPVKCPCVVLVNECMSNWYVSSPYSWQGLKRHKLHLLDDCGFCSLASLLPLSFKDASCCTCHSFISSSVVCWVCELLAVLYFWVFLAGLDPGLQGEDNNWIRRSTAGWFEVFPSFISLNPHNHLDSICCASCESLLDIRTITSSIWLF